MATEPLSSQQRKFLRAQAHHLDPVIVVGKMGVTDSLITATDRALEAHELIKVRFLEFKDEKKRLTPMLAEATDSAVAGILGHVAILYRQHPDEKHRKIVLP
jgi:RNA-binding protein